MARALEALPEPTGARGEVCLALSGGIDSAVSGWLLREKGFRVSAAFLHSWDAADAIGETCCPESQDLRNAEKLAEKIGVDDFHVFNVVADYWQSVFAGFLEGFRRGETPNPDLPCNRFIKFGKLWDRAIERNARFLALGHYARVEHVHDGVPFLLRSTDFKKDQSYFLASVRPDRLNKVLFPVGACRKDQVVQLGKRLGLSLPSQKPSRGICMVGKQSSLPSLLQSFLDPPSTVDVIDIDTGKILQTNSPAGIPFSTVGQRAKIGGQNHACYVVEKTPSSVTICEGANHPALHAIRAEVRDPLLHPAFQKLLQGTPEGVQCFVKLGSREELASAVVSSLESGRLLIEFTQSRRRVGKGQVSVFYWGDRCLGSGTISRM